MPGSKLKNIILAILLAANLLLLIILIPSCSEQKQQNKNLLTQLAERFSAEGVALLLDRLPESSGLFPLTAEYSEEEQAAAAAALLGTACSQTENGDRYTGSFTAAVGSVEWTRNGEIRAVLTASGEGTSDDWIRTAKKTCRAMGLTERISGTVSHTDSGEYTVEAMQYISGMPVFSGVLTMTYEEGRLTGLEGTYYTGIGSAVADTDVSEIASADALVSFLNQRNELGWVGSEVRSVQEGYRISGTASASTVRLLPVWQIETDTGVFYVNAVDGSISE